MARKKRPPCTPEASLLRAYRKLTVEELQRLVRVNVAVSGTNSPVCRLLRQALQERLVKR